MKINNFDDQLIKQEHYNEKKVVRVEKMDYEEDPFLTQKPTLM
jgi:hypothetical protein